MLLRREEWALWPCGLLGGDAGPREQRRQGRLPSREQCRVTGCEFAVQHAHRPAVENHMLDEEREDVFVGRQIDDATTHERTVFQIERSAEFILQPRDRGRLAAAFGGHGRRKRVERPRAGRRNGLHYLAIDEREGGSQSLVSGHDPVECYPKRPDIKRAADAMDEADRVACRIGCELLQKPESLLGRRGRDRAWARGDRIDHRRCRLLLVGGCPVGRRGDGLRQPGQRGVRIEKSHGHRHPQRLPHRRHHLHRHERIAAEFEEVVVHTHPIEREQIAPDRSELLLQWRARRDVDLGGILRHCFGRPGRQRPAIELATRGQRHRLEPHISGGQHVIGQRLR